jgi:hypothetical protein
MCLMDLLSLARHHVQRVPCKSARDATGVQSHPCPWTPAKVGKEQKKTGSRA